MTRYLATITHYSIARARMEPVGDTLTAAKRNATREFSGQLLDAVIEIIDTHTATHGDLPEPGNQAVVAARRVSDRRWSIPA